MPKSFYLRFINYGNARAAFLSLIRQRFALTTFARQDAVRICGGHMHKYVTEENANCNTVLRSLKPVPD